MMKFVVNQVADGGGRLGTLSLVSRHGKDITMDTPTCLLYSKCGSVPNLSSDVASNIQRTPSMMQVTTPSVIPSQDVLEELGKGLASFIGQPDVPIYLSVQDPLSPCPTGYNEKNVVSIWSTGGRVKLSPESYMSLVEACKPVIFEALSDGDTPQGSSTKRIRKSVDRTVDYLDTCIELWQSSEKLKTAALLGVVQGGDMSSQRKWCAKEIAKRPVSGFMLDGFHEGAMETTARWSLLKEVVGELPDTKLRMLPRAGRPDDVLKAVERGVDVFDSSFPLEVTNRGCALVFKFEQSRTVPEEQEESVDSNKLPHSSNKDQKPAQPITQPETDEVKDTSSQAECKNIEVKGDSSIGKTGSQSECKNVEAKGDSSNNDMTVYEVNLKESRFFDDFRPVLPSCSCYCCQNHTRAYINHLLNTKELLAHVLLTIHNLHHYFRFFEAIRESIAKGTFEHLVKLVTEER
ncbi:queuine tRNA-ribosyltransferase accessory subunit 2-like isoform X2 [Amphiura filiformis]